MSYHQAQQLMKHVWVLRSEVHWRSRTQGREKESEQMGKYVWTTICMLVYFILHQVHYICNLYFIMMIYM